MSPELIDLLSSAPLHVILLVALYVVWKRLEKVTDQLISLRTDVQALHAMTAQNGSRKDEAPD